jgi:hypothetical protein
MGFGFRGQSQNSAIVDYLKGPTGAGYKRVSSEGRASLCVHAKAAGYSGRPHHSNTHGA